MAQLMEGFGRHVQVEVYVDSSAALAITARKGNGKLRHVRVSELWIQEVANDGTIAYKKVAGTQNAADLMTKHVTAAVAKDHIDRMNMRVESGRAKLGLEA